MPKNWSKTRSEAYFDKSFQGEIEIKFSINPYFFSKFDFLSPHGRFCQNTPQSAFWINFWACTLFWRFCVHWAEILDVRFSKFYFDPIFGSRRRIDLIRDSGECSDPKDGKIAFLEVLGPFPGRKSISGRILAGNGRFWIFYGSIENLIFYLPLEGFVKIRLKALPGVQNVLKYTILVEISGELELLPFRGVEISVENFSKKNYFLELE